jgi:hypothetical protein
LVLLGAALARYDDVHRNLAFGQAIQDESEETRTADAAGNTPKLSKKLRNLFAAKKNGVGKPTLRHAPKDVRVIFITREGHATIEQLVKDAS